ncbi:MAG: glycosyltransferase [Myxococcales bacterium]|nr:glycosyltransferase [Myxococcales bacterium]
MTEESNTGAGLSLCMIVRDEAEMLPQCLEHAQGVWDELIVVDTGSKDDTVAIAKKAGAKIIERPWDEDFAAARNAALDAASGSFILTLDADELLSDKLKDQIRHAVEDAQVGAATVNVRNLLPHGLVRTAPLLRLFRNDSEIRYRYPIHEEITSTLQPYLARTGQKVIALSGDIEHRGYVRERAAGRGKKERDLKILDRCLAADTGDLYSHYKRLELARYWDDLPLWEKAAREAQEALDQAGPQALSGQHFAGDFLCLIARGLYSSEKALSFVTTYRDNVPSSAELHYFCGQRHEEAKRPDEAKREFEACLSIDGVRDLQMATVRPLMGLCRLAMAAGDQQSARKHADAALAHGPRDPEVLLAGFTLRWAQEPEQARRFGEQQIAEQGECPEIYNAWGQAAMVYGDGAAAVAAFRKLAGEPPKGQAALHLAQALVRQNHLQEAHAILSSLVPQMPEAGIGVLVCELALDRDTQLELDLDEKVAEALLREWLTTALLGADDEILRNVAKRVPTIEHVFPWLPEALGLAA